MPSRVVHVRLDDWALIGCHDILKMGGKPVNDISMSTMVRQIVNALVRNMQVNDKIPTYTKEERYDRLEELYKDEVFELDTGLDPVDIIAEQAERDDDISDLVRDAVARIESEGEPQHIAEEVTIAEVAEEAFTETASVNIMLQECTPFTTFKKQAPKDRFIEWAADHANPVIEQAVAIAYTGLPRDLWGSDKAEEIITGLMKRHRAE